MADLDQMLDLQKRYEEAKKAQETAGTQDLLAGIASNIANRPTFGSIMLGRPSQRLDVSPFKGDVTEKPEDILKLYQAQKEAEKDRANRLEVEQMKEKQRLAERGEDWQRQLQLKGMEYGQQRSMKELERAEKAEQKAQEVSVPGFEPIPGAKPNPKDAETVKSGFSSHQQITSGLKNMKSIVTDAGPELTGSNADKLGALATNVRLQAKELYRLGQLSAGDIDMVEKLIPSGTNWGDWLKFNAKDKLLQRLDTAQNIMDENMKALATTRGYRQTRDVLANEGPKKVIVQRGSEKLEIDESDLAAAEAEGYKMQGMARP